MKNVKTLSLVWYVLGSLQVLGALIFGVMFTGMGAILGVAGGDEESAVVGGVMAVVGVITGGIILLTTIPAFLVGWGLGKRKGWARILAMILGVFQMLSFPIGTAIGVWTVWLLLLPEVEAEFKAAA